MITADSFLTEVNSKIDKINTLRQHIGEGVMAVAAVKKIFDLRKENLSNDEHPIPTIYVINSLKHPLEYDLLRHIYRRNFVLLSIYDLKKERLKNLKQSQLSSLNNCNSLSSDELSDIEKLMKSDEKDDKTNSGRSTLDLYHKSHYFIHSTTFQHDIQRFVELIFNNPFLTPTKEEVGMMYAYYSSLRSSDLSRQVGAAILDDDGNLLTTGLNEVPKFGGGLHWCDTEPDKRDFQCTDDNNQPLSTVIKQSIYKEFEQYSNNFLHDSLEFVRAVHAEEAAICDAAARGISIKGATLYCTTFPCHLCTKHIIAAGLKKVVYIEPYSKSKSEELFEGLVRDKASSKDENVLKLMPFKGVCPKRYRYVFSKSKKDRMDGQCGNRVKQWNIKNSEPIYLSHSTPIGYYKVEMLYLERLSSALENNSDCNGLFRQDFASKNLTKSFKDIDEKMKKYSSFEVFGIKSP
jgi:cytidine deaminase